MSPLCLIHLNMTSTVVWGHILQFCLHAAHAKIALGHKSGPSFLSVARTSRSACLMDRSPESNGNEQICQVSNIHRRNPQGREVIASLFLDPRSELCIEADDRQLCLHCRNYLKSVKLHFLSFIIQPHFQGPVDYFKNRDLFHYHRWLS